MHAPHLRQLRILHVVRASVGGLFRHICDLAAGQAARGHAVGIVADSRTGGERAEQILSAMEPQLALGLWRFPIARNLGPSDLLAVRRLAHAIGTAAPDVIHGHGAKGGAFARLCRAQPKAARVYTPHGGSLHYSPASLSGAVYGRIERLLMRRTDLFLFESAYARNTYAANVAIPSPIVRVVYNGVAEEEFEPVAPAAGASDLVFVGELRRLKGVDVLLPALATLRGRGRTLSLTIAGEGPDGEAFRAQAKRLGLDGSVRFAGYRPAREAFAMGHILVVPSRNESLPYTVLEGAAAGVPVIATAVGGIPEIFGPDAQRLVPPADVAALAGALSAAVDDRHTTAAAAQRLRDRVRRQFSLKSMVAGALDGYSEALSERLLAAE